MTDLVASLILRLVDRLSRPARGAAAAIGAIAKAERQVSKDSGAAAGATDKAAKADTVLGKTAAAARARNWERSSMVKRR